VEASLLSWAVLICHGDSFAFALRDLAYGAFFDVSGLSARKASPLVDRARESSMDAPTCLKIAPQEHGLIVPDCGLHWNMCATATC
jgi:hypothetical protein